VIVLDIFRSVKKRRRRLADLLFDLVHHLGVPLELILVAATEFAPFVRVVTEPAPQACARGDVLQPEVYTSFTLADAARP